MLGASISVEALRDSRLAVGSAGFVFVNGNPFQTSCRDQPHELAHANQPQQDVTMAKHVLHNEFTAIIERDDEWYVGYCPEIPGANGQGKSVEDCKENLA